MTNEDRRILMLEAPPLKVVPRLALPTVVSLIVESIYNLADTFYVSSLGEAATAAVATNDSFMHILLSIGSGFAFGAGSYVARLLGAKENNHASTVASTTLLTSLLTAFAFILLLWPTRKSLVVLFGSTQEAINYAIDYATWIIFAFPFTAASGFLNQMHKSEGKTTFAMVGIVSGCAINCILDPIFINNLGLKVGGAAIATMISKIISTVVLAIPYIKKNTVLTISLKNVRFNYEDFIEVFKIGIATSLRMSLMSIAGIITNNKAKIYGTAAQAAISIANKINKFVASVIMGFAQGFGPIVGYCYGAQRYSRVKELYYSTIKLGLVCGAIFAIASWIFAGPMVNIFNSTLNPVVTEIGSCKMRSLCIGCLPHIFLMITNNMYQALGKPIGNTVIGLSRQVIFLIPLLLILPNYFGVYGVACAQGVSDVLSGIIIALPCAILLMKDINKKIIEEDPTILI